MGRSRKTTGQQVAAPKTETKHEKFERILPPRMRRALTAIALVGNCASPAYEATDSEVDFIRDTLLNAVNMTMAKFKRSGAKVEFTLPRVAA